MAPQRLSDPYPRYQISTFPLCGLTPSPSTTGTESILDARTARPMLEALGFKLTSPSQRPPSEYSRHRYACQGSYVYSKPVAHSVLW